MSSASTCRCYQMNRSNYIHLFSNQLLYLFSLFHKNDYSIRIVGGAVRDILLGVKPHDIDLATTATKSDMLKLIAADSNIKYIYTRAAEFGTLTFVVGTTVRETFQVSTLKRSIIRHEQNICAEFTDDWNIDAQNRDFTINSLSMDENGVIYDYTNGIDDLKMHRIRFNGNVITRLQENPIRILRYFRFVSCLSVDPLVHETDVLDAIRLSSSALKNISGESIWRELEMILRGRFAGHTMRIILQQQFAPILGLPESTVGMFELENRWLRCMEYEPEPITILTTLFNDLNDLETFRERIPCKKSQKDLGKFLLQYRYSILPAAGIDSLSPYKELVMNTSPAQHIILRKHISELLKYQGHVHLINDFEQWIIPEFPVNRFDLLQQGLIDNRQLQKVLHILQKYWKSSQGRLTKQELMDYGFYSGIFYT